MRHTFNIIHCKCDKYYYSIEYPGMDKVIIDHQEKSYILTLH